MSTVVLLTLTGLGLGALYFLIAAGLSLIFGLADVLNFAHGVFLSVGAYGTWWAAGHVPGAGPDGLGFLLAVGVGMLAGPVVDEAVRAEGSARPGEIVASDDFTRLVGAAFSAPAVPDPATRNGERPPDGAVGQHGALTRRGHHGDARGGNPRGAPRVEKPRGVGGRHTGEQRPGCDEPQGVQREREQDPIAEAGAVDPAARLAAAPQPDLLLLHLAPARRVDPRRAAERAADGAGVDRRPPVRDLVRQHVEHVGDAELAVELIELAHRGNPPAAAA